MKNYSKKIIMGLILLIGLIMLITYKMEKDAEEYKAKVERFYEMQNKAIPRVEGPLILREYITYEKVDERKLYISLFVYNSDNEEKEDLKLSDFEEYLVDEFNKDGTLRVMNCEKKILDYKDWWFLLNGAGKIEDYYWDIEEVYIEYSGNYVPCSYLSLDKIKEIIKVVEGEIELSEVNNEIMDKEDPDFPRWEN